MRLTQFLIIFLLLYTISGLSQNDQFTTLVFNSATEEIKHQFLELHEKSNSEHTAEVLYIHSDKAFKDKNYSKAEGDLKKILQNETSIRLRLQAYILLGQCYREMKLYEQSIKCLKNAEALLSGHRYDESLQHESSQDLIAQIYLDMSLSYLKWNKYASAIIYLWAARRNPLFNTMNMEGENPIAVQNVDQKKLLNYPLYKFITKPINTKDEKSSIVKYYKKIEEGNRDFKKFREAAKLKEHIYITPLPRDEVKNPTDKAELYEIHYNSMNKILYIVYNDKEAMDFNKNLYYQNDVPVSSFYESHTYHSTAVKFDYEKNKLKRLCIIQIPTQTGHFGFIPDVRYYEFK